MTVWQPSADQPALISRAQLLADLRGFFRERNVLEVETPLLAQFGVTDVGIDNFPVPTDNGDRFLQSSPEYAMKRLLAAGSGDIFQICKAFRRGESGRRHNPEYTLLEWYRLGFDDRMLAREVGDLLCRVLERSGWQEWRWNAVFEELLGIDALTASDEALMALARQKVGELPSDLDRNGLLDLLMTHCIEPAISDWGIVFIVDYPPSQAALARQLERSGQNVAARFECYVDGIELANGYWESVNEAELAARFNEDRRIRSACSLPERAIDDRLLAAMRSGLPDCAGVALGVDRLLALKTGCSDIRDTLAFPWATA